MGLETKYLEECAEKLKQSIAELRDQDEVDANTELQKISALLQSLLSFESECRNKYEIGARFNVIHSQLENLITTWGKALSETSASPAVEVSSTDTQSNEEIVYVYLFNAQGMRLSSWNHLLSPSALMDMSVNRPIYARKEDVEELLRSKMDVDLHAYLKIAIKKEDLLMPLSESILKDNFGNLLLRVKHGAFCQNKIIEFYHKGKTYLFSKETGLVLKP